MTSAPLTQAELAELFDQPVIVTPVDDPAAVPGTARVYHGDRTGIIVTIQTLHEPYGRALFCESCGKVTPHRRDGKRLMCAHEDKATRTVARRQS